MSSEAQDGDKAVTFATLALVGGSVVNTTTSPLYLQEKFGTIVQEAGCIVRAGPSPHLNSVLRLSSP